MLKYFEALMANSVHCIANSLPLLVHLK